MLLHGHVVASREGARPQSDESSKADKSIVNNSSVPLTPTNIQKRHGSVDQAEVSVQNSE